MDRRELRDNQSGRKPPTVTVDDSPLLQTKEDNNSICRIDVKRPHLLMKGSVGLGIVSSELCNAHTAPFVGVKRASTRT